MRIGVGLDKNVANPLIELLLPRAFLEGSKAGNDEIGGMRQIVLRNAVTDPDLPDALYIRRQHGQ